MAQAEETALETLHAVSSSKIMAVRQKISGRGPNHVLQFAVSFSPL